MDFDILIIGGGPSGLSTALHLQQIAPHLSARILILEKAHYPRLKLCAGGLVIDAEILLERLGLDVREVPHVIADAPPVIETHIIDNGETPAGMGEMGLPPLAPALANAIFAATGKRVRELPIGDQLSAR